MSKLDELLEGLEEDALPLGRSTQDRAREARAELAALRQRAEDAEMRERAAIVKWMREWASDTYWGDLVASTLHVAADNIERGEHLLTDEARKALGEKR